MPNWWVSREAVKRAAEIDGAERDIFVDAAIVGVSRAIERRLRRFFIPRTETRLYRWPRRVFSLRSSELILDQDLIAVTTLQTKAQDSSPTTIAAADFFVEPNNEGPPYSRIEIDASSNAAFEGGDTPQRSISVAGRWGYGEDTITAGTVASGLASSATATSMVCSDASLIDVGDTLLIESEQVFVSERANAANGSDLVDMAGNIAADLAVIAITVDDGSLYNAGEVILIDSEKMYVESISGNVLTVTRAYDGSVLATHNDDTAVHVFRTLTIVRGMNGTTAATHTNSTAVTKYEPPGDIVMLAKAEAISVLQQEKSAWGREVGQGDGSREWKGGSLQVMRKEVLAQYRRRRMPVAI